MPHYRLTILEFPKDNYKWTEAQYLFQTITNQSWIELVDDPLNWILTTYQLSDWILTRPRRRSGLPAESDITRTWFFW